LARRDRNAQNAAPMQPLAIRLRATRKRFVAESESEMLAALATAEQVVDQSGSLAFLDFMAANGSTLSMVVGGAETALSFRYAGDKDPVFLSLGNSTATGTFPCVRDANEKIDCARWTLISREEGLAALNEFATSNEIPQCVQWAPFSVRR
jgi:hypothetical protein